MVQSLGNQRISQLLTGTKSRQTYTTKLRKAEHDAPEWHAAMEALLLVAEHGGPTMFARMGVMPALNRHVERVFNSSGMLCRRFKSAATLF